MMPSTLPDLAAQPPQKGLKALFHDLNNVFTSILGTVIATQEGISPLNVPLQGAMENIQQACKKGADSIRHYAKTQATNPMESLDLNVLVQEAMQFVAPDQRQRLYFHPTHPLLPFQGQHTLLCEAFTAILNSLLAYTTSPLDIHTWATQDTVHMRLTGWVASTADAFELTMPFSHPHPWRAFQLAILQTDGLPWLETTDQAHALHVQWPLETETIPPGDAHPPTNPIPVFEPATFTTPPLNAKLVLLVDNNEALRNAFLPLFHAIGLGTVLANSGEQALERLVGGGLKPDLIILDCPPRDMGILETLPALRKPLPNVPIFMSTEEENLVLTQLVKRFPPVTILKKPFGFATLKQHILKALT